jgi:small conductance mechanosensitive channel
MQSTEIFTVSAEWIARNVYSLGVALAVLLGGWYLSGVASRLLRAALHSAPKMVDVTIAPILTELLRYTILGLTLVIVLGQFGVQTASILAVLGAIGLAIALALQGTLSNMAAGIMLLWLRPFEVTETIDAEVTSGTVIEIGLFATRIKTYDGIFVFVPNSKLWNARIVNWSREPTRMVEVKIGISYGSSIDAARAALQTIVTDERVLADPAPTIFVSALTDSVVTMCVRMWVNGSDWWSTYIAMMERAATALQKAEIDIGRDTLDVRLLGDPAATGNQTGGPQ